MPDSELVRELRIQAKMYNHAADVLEGKTARTTTSKTRKISAEGRRNIALAQKKRWALVKGGKKAA